MKVNKVTKAHCLRGVAAQPASSSEEEEEEKKNRLQHTRCLHHLITTAEWLTQREMMRKKTLEEGEREAEERGENGASSPSSCARV